jgi:phosphate starvation-inducible PhoH-like protein
LEEDCRLVVDEDALAAVCGPQDENLRVIEAALGGRIAVRGNEMAWTGDSGDGARFQAVIEGLLKAARSGEAPGVDYTRSLLDLDGGEKVRDGLIAIPHGFSKVFPRTKNQKDYIDGMRSHDITFCAGPAGTGKTYLAIAFALQMVLSKKLRRLVLTRPVVEAGESLGFLPGDLAQKINPYLRPLYDAMESLVPFEVVRRMEENHVIEIAPLAYMRGRSLNDSFIILDEAQNTTKEQMKMFLTRLGRASRAVITGDETQIDLPRKRESGLLHALRILRTVNGIHFAFLNSRDVVRNPLVRDIIKAYNEENEENNSERV